MGYFLKCSEPWASYVDPTTRITIRRGGVVSVDSLTNHMRKRLRAGGLVEATEKEFKLYQAAEKKAADDAASEKAAAAKKKHEERISKGEKSRPVDPASKETGKPEETEAGNGKPENTDGLDK